MYRVLKFSYVVYFTIYHYAKIKDPPIKVDTPQNLCCTNQIVITLFLTTYVLSNCSSMHSNSLCMMIPTEMCLHPDIGKKIKNKFEYNAGPETCQSFNWIHLFSSKSPPFLDRNLSITFFAQNTVFAQIPILQLKSVDIC